MGSDETGTSTPGQHGLRVERSVPSHSDHRWMEEQRDLIQEALLEGEERLQTLLEDAMAAVYLKDLQGRYLTANCWAEIMFRITLEEAVGKTDHELWPKEVADALRANDLKALEAGAPLRFDQFFLHEDGEYVYEASKFPLYDPAGDLYAVCGIATNVTKLKKTEEALRRQNEQLEALNETTLALMNRLESDDLLENILERAEALVGTSHGCINLVVEPGGDEMERRFGTGFFSRSVGERIKAGVGLAGKVLQTGERLVVEDYSSWPGRRPDIDSSPLRAAVGVPLRSGPRVAGVIALVRVQDESGFGDEDVEVLSRFAELASLVLDNAQLHDSAQRELAERERAEKELREREERFRALVQNSSDVVTVLDAGGTILYVSPAVERVLGYNPEERVGGSSFDNMHPDDVERMKSAYAEAANAPGGISGPTEFRMRHADGSWRYMETIRNNLLDEPSVRGIVANLRDVTERKEAEEERRKSEEWFRSLIQNSSDIVTILESDGTISYESPSIEHTLGYRSEELVGKNAFDYIHPDDKERIFEVFDTVPKNREARTNPTEFRFRHKDGSWRYLEAVGNKLTDRPSVGGIVANSRDVTERKEAEEALRRSEQRLHTVVSNVPVVLFALDREGVFTLSEGRGLEALGLEPGEAVGRSVFELYRDVPEVLEGVRRVLAGEAITPVVEVAGRVFESSYTPLWDEDGGVSGAIGVATDITERKRAEEELRESEKRYRAVMEQSAEGIWLFDPDTKRVLESNESFQKLLGYTSGELLEMTVYDFIARERDTIDASVRRDLRERRRFGGEWKFRRKDGSLIDIEVSMTVIPYHGREAVCGVARDVTERKALEEQLRRRALYDPLTELPNRVLFLERVGHALARTDRLDEPVAVLFVDLDDFKVINDSLGHDAGNALLVDVARRLRTCVRPGDTVARLFGDEFAVLLEAPAELDDARRVAERIGECLQQEPFVLDGREAFVTTSIGIALGGSAGDEPKDVLRRADLAMYTAKKGRKARYEVFQPSMGDRAVERLDLENQLRRAIEREEFEVHYQPVIELRSGKINGVEALVRWRHPERGLVFPKEFIVLAEETGLIRPIGQWVLEEACRQAMQWRERYPDKALLMSVNLSTSQFGYQPDLISGVLNDTGMDPQNLQLEITERVVMDDAEALGKLRRLKDLGVRFAIDDYGTGYSSLSYLKRMPVSVLKIDHAFVAGLGRDWGDEAIVAGTVSLAHVLGLEVVAEGVETEDQLAKLEELECDMAQGFYLGKPLPGEAIQSLLGL